TQGRAFWGLEFARWSPVPTSLLQSVVEGIRKRNGLSLEPPKASDLAEQSCEGFGLNENLVRPDLILFQSDSVPFPNHDMDYSDQEQWRCCTILDNVVH